MDSSVVMREWFADWHVFDWLLVFLMFVILVPWDKSERS